MARQGKILPARRAREGAEESLLIRSAESLGRMIGSLQRQLDGTAADFTARAGDLRNLLPNGDGHGRQDGDGPTGSETRNTATTGARKQAGRSGAAAASKNGAAKGGARKSGGAAKTGGRKSGGGSKGAGKPAAAGRKTSGATKTRSTADRTSKRAAKSARAKKSAGRGK